MDPKNIPAIRAPICNRADHEENTKVLGFKHGVPVYFEDKVVGTCFVEVFDSKDGERYTRVLAKLEPNRELARQLEFGKVQHISIAGLNRFKSGPKHLRKNFFSGGLVLRPRCINTTLLCPR